MASLHSFTHLLLYFLIIALIFPPKLAYTKSQKYNFSLVEEATINDLQTAFKQNKLTSKELVRFYLNQIRKLNPVLRAVIEVNPDAMDQAAQADEERKAKKPVSWSGSHGIPVLLKDNIATNDKLNTTAGSYALLGSVVPRDAGAGAVILGKASLSEWAYFRSTGAPNGWGARSGQGRNPYNLKGDPCGSSSGSAIAVAANMAAVSLGTETDGSILCPSSYNGVVGIKPTVGLTSRSGVVPVTPRQDTVGLARNRPICRTVMDAVHVLDAIVGYDMHDSRATRRASKYIPKGGYLQFLNLEGLNRKRIGIVRNPFFTAINGSLEGLVFNRHMHTMRKRRATLIDNLEIANIDKIMQTSSGERTAILAEFKVALNSYLSGLVSSPIRSLADAIAFNKKFSEKEKIKEYGQSLFLASEATNGIGLKEKKALLNMQKLTREGFEKVMKENKLDAIVTPGTSFITILAIGGFPGISVPVGFGTDGMPFGVCFGGLSGFEPRLIEIAYAFEQATRARKPPSIR